MEAARTTVAFGCKTTRRLGHRVDVGLGRGIGLGHDDDVGHAQHRLARMMRGLMTRPQRIDQDDLQIGPHEREIVVAAVPDDDVRLRLGKSEDAGVVDAGKDDIARTDVRFVLLALLDRALGGVEIAEACEALHRLALEIAIGHGMAHHGDPAGLAASEAAPASVRSATCPRRCARRRWR